MEDIFSSNSANIIQKNLNINLNSLFELKTNQDLDFYFDIDKIVDWINQNNFKKVFLNIKNALIKSI